MAFKFIVIAAFLATANAGVTLTSTSDNTYRSQGNLASISTQSKSIETPYSSSSKNEVRVTNPSVYVTASPLSYQYASTPAPVYTKAIQHGYNYQSPLSSLSSLSYTPTNYQQSYVVPAHSEQQYYQTPVVAKTYQPYQLYQNYQNYHHYQPAVSSYQVAQPTQMYSQAAVAPVAPVASVASVYAPPMHHYAHAPVVQQPVVKVAYSPASEVAHLTYSNINDHVNYAW